MISFESLLAEFMKDEEFRIAYHELKVKYDKLEKLLHKTNNPLRKKRILKKLWK